MTFDSHHDQTQELEAIIDEAVARFNGTVAGLDIHDPQIDRASTVALAVLEPLYSRTVRVIDHRSNGLLGRSAVHRELERAISLVTHRQSQHRACRSRRDAASQRAADQIALAELQARVGELEQHVDKLRRAYRASAPDRLARLRLQLEGQRAALELAEARCDEHAVAERLGMRTMDFLRGSQLDADRCAAARAVEETEHQLNHLTRRGAA
ncbi:hypothetical protein [Gordonia alkanivorans]|uniref:hypothetical protein n=1 Tax=Gordonia alkanivorans TaxID=84096 RepID=UPI0012DF9642|nr:hypothetical protein [Gordonia alkanivorans]